MDIADHGNNNTNVNNEDGINGGGGTKQYHHTLIFYNSKWARALLVVAIRKLSKILVMPESGFIYLSYFTWARIIIYPNIFSNASYAQISCHDSIMQLLMLEWQSIPLILALMAHFQWMMAYFTSMCALFALLFGKLHLAPDHNCPRYASTAAAYSVSDTVRPHTFMMARSAGGRGTCDFRQLWQFVTRFHMYVIQLLSNLQCNKTKSISFS